MVEEQVSDAGHSKSSFFEKSRLGGHSQSMKLVKGLEQRQQNSFASVMLDETQGDEELRNDIDQVKKRIKDPDRSREMPSIVESPMCSPRSRPLAERFLLEEGEKLLDSFVCAYKAKILLQGRLYLSTKRLCFHSYFNDSTLFGRATRLAIPLQDVQSIEKCYNAIVFDNSINIFTRDGQEIFFTSFVARDACYELIQDVLYPGDKKNPEEEQEEEKKGGEEFAFDISPKAEQLP